MKIKEEIKKAIVNAIVPFKSENDVLPEFVVEHPADETKGDWATNVALVMFGNAPSNPPLNLSGGSKSPRELAEKIKTELEKDVELMKLIEKIEVAGPGFINFFLRTETIVTKINEILDEKWDRPLSGKKASVEYTDPNPFKEFHLGHLYSNLIGESIARICEECGATVWRADFYGDVGMHVAKSIWGIQKKMREESVSLEDLKKMAFKDRQHFLGQGYALGVNAYVDDEKVQEEVKKLNQLIFVAGQENLKKTKGWQPVIDYRKFIEGREEELAAIQSLYEAGLAWSLEYFETYYRRLGTKFDGYYPESWVGEYGIKEVEKGLKMGVLEESQGAVIFPGEKYGLHTRVFRNKFGLPTYEAKDLGLVMAKYQDFKFDSSLNIFGKEIDEYYDVVHKAMTLIEPELGAKQDHLAHGMVKLPTGKMSSRTGNVITVEWLLNEAAARAKALINNETLSEEEKDGVAEKVGQAAVKYALLKNGIGGDVVFDFDQSVTFEGASGPYLQYTYARTCGVLAKSKIIISNLETPHFIPNLEESNVLKQMAKYEEAITRAMQQKAPNVVADYLFGLAQSFNAFYNKHSILEGEKESLVFRLGLTKAVGDILKKGLLLLGIEVVEKM